MTQNNTKYYDDIDIDFDINFQNNEQLEVFNNDVQAEINEEINAEINQGSDAGKSFEQLIIENEKFIYSVVNKEFKNTPWDIKPDLYSAGKQGLVYAATKFDSKNYKNKFISYAVNWIRYFVNEELRNMYPVKLNQNYVYKRNKIKKFIAKYEKEFNRQPTYEEISKELGLSVKVIGNILGINNGENFSFVSFQSVNKDAGDDPGNENYMENKLINEYLEESVSDADITKFEFKDLLIVLKKRVAEKDFNMFVDKYINNLSYSEIAKKYKLNFPSSAKYVIERVEKICKELLT